MACFSVCKALKMSGFVPRFSLRYFAVHVQGVKSLNSLRVRVPKFRTEVFMFLW